MLVFDCLFLVFHSYVTFFPENNDDNCILLQLGLGSILFAVNVDSPELNIAMTAESVSPRQNNEIIIAVPTVNSSTNERKSVSSKRAAIISFEEEENASLANNNLLKSSTPPKTVSPADACLTYQEKQKIAEEKSKPKFVSDSAYERLHAEPISIGSMVHPQETEYIEPESPTAIKIITPITQTYQSSHTTSLSTSYDYKEHIEDSSISKTTDSSSITSNTTTHSSNSPSNQVVSQPSQSDSMNSSISSAHNSISNSPTNEEDPSSRENELVSQIQELTTVESEHIRRIHELEKRCASLEEKVTTLTR